MRLTDYYMKKEAGMVDKLKSLFVKVKPQVRQFSHRRYLKWLKKKPNVVKL